MEIDDVAKAIEALKAVKGTGLKTEANVTVQRDWPVGCEVVAEWANGAQRKKLLTLARDYSDYFRCTVNSVTIWILQEQVAALVFVRAARIVEASEFDFNGEAEDAHLF